MIELEITSSSDFDRIGGYYFCKDIITIGKDIDASDIFLPLEDITNIFLKIKIDDNKLYATPIVEDTFFLVNGKRTTAIKLIKNLDVLTIGSTIIKITNFFKEVQKTRKEFLNNRVQKLQDENSELIPILQDLSEHETEL